MGKNIILILRFYRYFLSPLLGQHCRFYPSCSSYAIQAIESHGFFRGCYLMVRRIFSCHPWHQGGFDPIPEKNKHAK